MSRHAPTLLRLALTAALAFSLTGCISLLPKQKPSTLYRFGVQIPAEAAQAPAERVNVHLSRGQFQREAAGDRILTISGEKAAYIAGARWVSPAEVLFEEAVQDAFDVAQGRARLVSRGESRRADYTLRLDVRTFETRYVGERPTVVVRLRAVLLKSSSGAEPAERTFVAEAPAGDNRLSAIVPAYESAVNQVLEELVAWVDGASTPVRPGASPR